MFLPLLLAAVQVIQPQPVQQTPPGLLRADANRDGVITRAEAAAAADARFVRFDANRDGSVTGEERRAAVRARRDRPVTAAEFQHRAQARFARMDANRDGVLTGDERPARRGMRGHHGRGPDGEHHRMRGDGAQRGAAVTAAQFRGRALARFDRLDADRDGRVDRGEIAAKRTARRG